MDFKALDAHMATNSYVEGYAASQKDVAQFKAMNAAPPANFVHAARWYAHISSMSASFATLPGTFTAVKVGGDKSKPADAAPAAEGKKKEKAPKADKGGKQEAPKKEEPKKEEKGGADDKAKKEAEKLKAKIIKEGGKKGVEIEGASDMGGLDFFCTTMELPEGNTEFLEMSMVAMNADPDPEAEDRKGCSGHVGKMIFSAGTEQLAIVAYVPGKEHNKSAENVDCKEWLDHVLAAVGGTVVKPVGKADSPKGGVSGVAVVKSDPEKGKFAIKDKDTAMQAAFAFLRTKGAFPEDNGDDSDEMIFGDDDCLDDWA